MNQSGDNPNSKYWQAASLDAARMLGRLMTWQEYDAFFCGLEGLNHQQIANTVAAKIAQLRQPKARREFMARRLTVGYDDRGNAVEFQENADGSWTNLYEEMIVPAEFIERHFSDLLSLQPV